MNLLLPIVLVIILPLLIAALLFLLPLLDKQINASCQQVANALGLNYLGLQRTETFKPLTKDLQFFSSYKPNTIPNVIRGEWNDTVILSFPFSISSGGSSNNTYPYQAVLIYSQQLKLPPFKLTAKILGGSWGREYIRIKNPQFSKHFLLKGEDEARVRAVFGHDVLDFCIGHRPKINLEASGPVMACYYRGGYVNTPDRLKRLITSTQALYQLLIADS